MGPYAPHGTLRALRPQSPEQGVPGAGALAGVCGQGVCGHSWTPNDTRLQGEQPAVVLPAHISGSTGLPAPTTHQHMSTTPCAQPRLTGAGSGRREPQRWARVLLMAPQGSQGITGSVRTYVLESLPVLRPWEVLACSLGENSRMERGAAQP